MGQRAPYDSEKDQKQAMIELADRISTYVHSPEFLTENSARFHNAMFGAMLISFYKYGALAEGYPDRVNAIGTPERLLSYGVASDLFAPFGSFGKRLRWYFFGEKNPYFGEPDEQEYNVVPGNTEYLVDAANFLMIEFMHPAHPKAHYRATDKEGSPGREAYNDIYECKGVQYKNTDLATATEKL